MSRPQQSQQTADDFLLLKRLLDAEEKSASMHARRAELETSRDAVKGAVSVLIEERRQHIIHTPDDPADAPAHLDALKAVHEKTRVKQLELAKLKASIDSLSREIREHERDEEKLIDDRFQFLPLFDTPPPGSVGVSPAMRPSDPRIGESVPDMTEDEARALLRKHWRDEPFTYLDLPRGVLRGCEQDPPIATMGALINALDSQRLMVRNNESDALFAALVDFRDRLQLTEDDGFPPDLVELVNDATMHLDPPVTKPKRKASPPLPSRERAGVRGRKPAEARS